MAKKLAIVHCRVCGGDIDRNADPNGKEWIMASRNYFYHKKCYEDWKNSTPATDEEYKDFIYDYIARDLKVTYDYHMCEAQREKFVKDNMTNKGIFFALKYFYDIKHNDWDKGHGGIGIVPFIYNESCTYWVGRERKSAGVVAEIERQMREAAERTKVKVKKQNTRKKKYETDFSILDSLEDEV